MQIYCFSSQKMRKKDSDELERKVICEQMLGNNGKSQHNIFSVTCLHDKL